MEWKLRRWTEDNNVVAKGSGHSFRYLVETISAVLPEFWHHLARNEEQGSINISWRIASEKSVGSLPMLGLRACVRTYASEIC